MIYLGNQAVGISTNLDTKPIIKQSCVTMASTSTTITFPVESKPWGLLISCASDSLPSNGTRVTRVDGLWTEYNGGQYVRGGFTVSRPNGYDHYVLDKNYFSYDDENKTISITVNAGYFDKNETYYLFYFTIPF